MSVKLPQIYKFSHEDLHQGIESVYQFILYCIIFRARLRFRGPFARTESHPPAATAPYPAFRRRLAAEMSVFPGMSAPVGQSGQGGGEFAGLSDQEQKMVKMVCYDLDPLYEPH